VQAVQVEISKERGTNPDAPLTLIIFTDFQCPYCKASLPVMNELEQIYGSRLNVIMAHFPLKELHPQAEGAAEASECAREQGKFRKYHDILFENQEDLSMQALLQYARIAGLDEAKFAECLGGRRAEDIVKADVRAGIAAGVQGTPTSFANGFRIEGVQPASSFTVIFDSEDKDVR
jgi:protein-disulfide isomerase